MTLGEHLSLLRRNAGMTQQELGEKLSISPQAVSKWENDLSEPDVATLKKIASLYGISLSRLLEFDSVEEVNSATDSAEPSPVHVAEEDVERISERVATSIRTETEGAPQVIGHCVQCGINVTEETVGETSPRLLCSDCVSANQRALEEEEKAKEEARIKAEEENKLREENEKQENEKRFSANQKAIRRSRNISLIIAGIVGIALLVFMLISGSSGESSLTMPYIVISVVLSYFLFAFVSGLFFDGTEREIIENFFDKSISFPGLIFTFDLDGIIWLIGMKLLFAVLGFVAGVIFAIIGIIVAFLISPFVFPIRMIKIRRYIKRGDLQSFLDEYK